MSSLFAAHERADAGPPPACYLRVAVERGIDADDPSLTYSAPELVAPGERVEVPLGRGNKAVGGIVTESGGAELAAGFPLERIKPILRRTGASLSPALMELARWISTYYVCPLGMVLATMMPAAVKQGIGRRTRLELERGAAPVEPGDGLKLTPAAKGVWGGIAALPEGVFPLTPAALKERLGIKSLAPINKLVKAGLLTEVRRSVVSAASAEWESLRVEASDEAEAIPELTPDQLRVVGGVSALLTTFGVHLLHGVTGSGKTEVYLRVLDRVLAEGRSALILVPEISLTPQTAGRFQSRFRRHGVAVLHSGLASAQRHKQWEAAASGAARVVVGARSAVFAPLENLGVIVVDEEHDSGYKQDQLPRYHARDTAIKRAQLQSIPIILGSATPSLESWHNAGAGRYKLWPLPNRIGAARLPKIDVVDIAAEARLRAASPPVSGGSGRTNPRFEQVGPTLERAINQTLDDGGQVILLINRRGYANFIACPNPRCGWVMTCTDCDAAMVHHKSAALPAGTGFVRCHHCLAEQLLPRECPLCASRVSLLGTGTQRVEEEVAKKFAARLGGSPGDPPERVPALFRFDSDSMTSARDYFSVLSRFAKGEIKLLLGTQMVSKGLDFPNVRLVGIVNADTALTLPDFRSAERTFQLVSQVAGRAGRGEHAGRVIVQTASPHAASIRFAAAHDYISFATDEIAHRGAASLPPMTRLARVVVRDEKLDKAQLHGAQLAEALARAPTARELSIDGPMPCAIARIAGFHRLEIVITSPRRAAIQEAFALLRARGLLTSDAHTAIDIDPVAMM